MKRVAAFGNLILLLLLAAEVSSQNIILENLAGDKNYYYQHSLSKTFSKDHRWGFFNASSFHAFYDTDALNELMSQSYITYALTQQINLAGGAFYATKPGIAPTVAVQFKFSNRYYKAAIVPRIDLRNNGSVEVMTFLEYAVPVSEGINFYARAQFMSNYGPRHHNRSYQYFRLGLKHKGTVMGMAVNVDERGPEKETLHNWGAFLRIEI